jgi:hypothetical protein
VFLAREGYQKICSNDKEKKKGNVRQKNLNNIRNLFEENK